MESMKKELAKAVKEIRKTYENTDYPKLMMTKVQMAKGTATVNCGNNNDAEKTERIMQSESIKQILNKYNATMKKEKAINGCLGEENWQVRISY